MEIKLTAYCASCEFNFLIATDRIVDCSRIDKTNCAFSVYDNYKFLTLAEVESLGLTGSIGQEWMRAEMHGYFIKMELYLKVVSSLCACHVFGFYTVNGSLGNP